LGKVVVIEHVTLDGVMQAPGRPEEDDRTYEDFFSVWPRTLKEPLPWRNSTLLDGDAADAVAKLKEEPGEDLGVLGSGQLVRSLMQRGLVDEFVLMIHPLVLGTGRRLFADGSAFAELRLTDATTTTTGVVIAKYQASAVSAADV